MTTSRTCFVHAVSIVSAIVISAHAHAGAPPLKPTEEIVKTLDGCALVIDKASNGAEYIRVAYSKLTWGGACVDGFAMGEGPLSQGFKDPNGPAMLPVTASVWYGRPFGAVDLRWDNGRVQRGFAWDGRSVSYRSLDVSASVWSKVHSESSMVNDGETMVMTLLIDKPIVMVTSTAHKAPAQQYPCPDASTKNCQALWAQHAGPVIERIKAFLAENEPKASARMQEMKPLVAKWKTSVGAAEVARREKDAKLAGEAQARQVEWDLGCMQKDTQALSDFNASTRPWSEREAQLGHTLKQLYEGPCAKHPRAKNGLERANNHLSSAAARKAEEEKSAKDAAAQNEQSKPEQDGQSGWALIGKVAGAAATATNSKDRKQAMLDALATPGSGDASSGGNVAGTSSTGSTGSGSVSGPGSPRPPAAPPASTGQTTSSYVGGSSSSLVEISLSSRWSQQYDLKKLRFPIAAHTATEANIKACQQNNGAGGCMNRAYQYDLGGFQNPFVLKAPETRTYPYTRTETDPSCKYTPLSYSVTPIERQAPEITCKQLLLQAIHEQMEWAVGLMRTGTGLLGSWASTPAVAGTSSGNCKADLAALDKEAARTRGRAATPEQHAQLGMYFAANKFRILEHSCKGTPEYEDVHLLRQQAGDLHRACSFGKTDTSMCVPKLP